MTALDTDAEARVSAPGLQFLAGIQAHLGNIASDIKYLKEREERYEREAALYVPLTASSNSLAPSGGSLIMDLSGPATGRIWLVRRLVVGGPIWSSTAAGSVTVYISPSNPVQVGTTGGATWAVVDEYATMPHAATYSNEQLLLRPGDRLYVEIVAPTGTNYCTGGLALSLPDKIAHYTI